MLAVSSRVGTMGNGVGDVGEWERFMIHVSWRGERLWHRVKRAVRPRRRLRRKTVCDDGEASGEQHHNQQET